MLDAGRSKLNIVSSGRLCFILFHPRFIHIYQWGNVPPLFNFFEYDMERIIILSQIQAAFETRVAEKVTRSLESYSLDFRE